MKENLTNKQITAVILAGGKGSRMNFLNKGLLKVQQQSLIEMVINKLKPHLDNILISANQDLDIYTQFHRPVICDEQLNFQGPLAGLLSARKYIQTPLTLVLPVDSPDFPNNYPQLMLQSYLTQNETCVAHDGLRPQYLFMLFETALFSDLADYFHLGGRSVKDWLSRHPNHYVYFKGSPSAFLNINTPEDLLLLNKHSNK